MIIRINIYMFIFHWFYDVAERSASTIKPLDSNVLPSNSTMVQVTMVISSRLRLDLYSWNTTKR